MLDGLNSASPSAGGAKGAIQEWIDGFGILK